MSEWDIESICEWDIESMSERENMSEGESECMFVRDINEIDWKSVDRRDKTNER